ncbi:MAG TPA: valine--tRNA ligase [Nitriliruptorales bacterium]|nr:valine--tRNA ligase [Nitriliruptorales bacterium]
MTDVVDPAPQAAAPHATAGPYDPAAVEHLLYEDWVSAGLFHAEADDPGEPFSIVIPPPNVTGSLHVGHALEHAIIDAVMRRARMEGKNAVWVPGTDHAGIATQNVVEQQLADEGVSRHDLGREAFIERVWRWREESGGLILQQMRRLGASCDWEREAFTFDEPRSRAVREVFVTLYEEGLIYRGNRLINWCPRCLTALSDIEVDHEDTVGELAYLRYPTVDGGDGVVVATTRPETMLGDTAVAVHPDDERYRLLVGATLRLPLVDREIPVIADDAVDPGFGTGAVKVTPAHDPNDHAIAQRHGLASVDIFTDHAVVDEAGGRFAGLERYAARAAVKEALAAEGLLVRVEPYTHAVGTCSRCGTVVEPRLSDQWFVAVTPLAADAIAAVEAGRVTFAPDRFTRPFLEWLRNLHDWCISRQIWWGHRIPAWYCPDGHITVAREEPDACATCGERALTQDEDVLDTWFSSALWPFTVFGWPEDTPALRVWYPTSVLVTGYDINTFWVSRMLMMGIHFLPEVPFRIVHNHGMVRDRYGKKMSKSFGNVLDPLDFVDRYGADALRFALLRHCSPGQDVPLAEEWVEGARRFANKLWNAIRLALQTLDGTRPGELPHREQLALEDRWVLSRLERCRATVHEATATGSWAWSTAAQTLYEFTWDELADWYLEAAKVRLYGHDEAARSVVQRVLATVLDDLLRLLHPLMPFVTETLWRAVSGATGGQQSLAAAAWPASLGERDHHAEARFALLQEVVGELRRFRAEHRIPPATLFPVALVTSRRTELEPLAPLLATLVGLSEVRFAAEVVDTSGTTTVVFPTGEAYVPLAGVIDVAGELERLRKELDSARGEVDRARGKLANPQFVERAPAEIVQRERDKQAGWKRVVAQLEEELAQLRVLEDGPPPS